MKKRVLIACSKTRPTEVLKQNLERFFGNAIEFEVAVITSDFNTLVGCDLVLAINASIANRIAQYLMEDTNIVVLHQTLRRVKYDMLFSIPLSGKVLVVNHSPEMTEESVSLLYELGIKNVELIPYYPGCTEVTSDMTIAITPNEEKYVPQFIKKTINVGDRCIDSSTLIDILSKLNMLNSVAIEKIIAYSNKIIPLNEGITSLTAFEHGYPFSVNQLLDCFGEGILIFDKQDHIVMLNRQANLIMNGKHKNLVDTDLKGLEIMESLFDKSKIINDELVEIGGKKYFITIRYFSEERNNGGQILIKKFDDIKYLYRKWESEQGRHNGAKYCFNDIIGTSVISESVKELAGRFAKTEYPILIQGESGTGKELLAQAIHRESTRRNSSFVAFNCAALADSLLESELFGYEEGAFTGARKNGKAGIFEIASGGTLFLDEIGDISLGVQAKLLRVLQEKEIVKVGGTQVIPIDIRVISATNKNLMELVEKKEFRLDLYYRLNTLLLETVPLRERKEDIRTLLSHFFRKKNIKKDIKKEALDYLVEYSWPGNIRELENCVSFLSIVERDIISVDELPPYIHMVKRNLIPAQVEKRALDICILDVLHKCFLNNKKVGRQHIMEKLKEYGYYISENELRKYINSQKEKEYLTVEKGRGGTKITEKGIHWYMNNL